MRVPLLIASFALLSCGEKTPESSSETAKERLAPLPLPWEPGLAKTQNIVSRFEDVDFVLEAKAPYPCKVNQALAPGENLVRVSFPVELSSVSERKVPMSALAFSLEDKEGHRYRPTLAGCAASIGHLELSSKESHQGEVAFDVPHPRAEFDLLFRPFIIGRKEIDARVHVPALGENSRSSD